MPEPLGGAHRDMTKAAKEMKKVILEDLEKLSKLPPDELVAKRYDKFRKMGLYRE
ncbi:MAG: hypothetical protein HQL28_06435 [Candidatus Omnitrophica bacterium]|nr:hypothetical protein [Candidatus Omnitrophota bacterium]